jgi:hypothetical protein
MFFFYKIRNRRAKQVLFGGVGTSGRRKDVGDVVGG